MKGEIWDHPLKKICYERNKNYDEIFILEQQAASSIFGKKSSAQKTGNIFLVMVTRVRLYCVASKKNYKLTIHFCKNLIFYIK
jgi:hypothetical protein